MATSEAVTINGSNILPTTTSPRSPIPQWNNPRAAQINVGRTHK